MNESDCKKNSCRRRYTGERVRARSGKTTNWLKKFGYAKDKNNKSQKINK